MAKKRFYDVSMSQKDGDMIGGVMGFAGMPQEVIQRAYPKENSTLPVNLNDGMSGIDKQKAEDLDKAKANLSPSKI